MDLLLDTHALFWAIYKPELLSEAATLAITASDNTTWATGASAQEIALKLAVGKWRAALDLLLHFEDRVAAAGFGHVVPTATDYANLLRLSEVLEHRDPFDRLVVAQALARGMTLVTSDPYAPLYGVPVIVAGRGERPNEVRSGRIVPVQALTPIRCEQAPNRDPAEVGSTALIARRKVPQGVGSRSAPVRPHLSAISSREINVLRPFSGGVLVRRLFTSPQLLDSPTNM